MRKSKGFGISKKVITSISITVIISYVFLFTATLVKVKENSLIMATKFSRENALYNGSVIKSNVDQTISILNVLSETITEAKENANLDEVLKSTLENNSYLSNLILLFEDHGTRFINEKSIYVFNKEDKEIKEVDHNEEINMDQDWYKSSKNGEKVHIQDLFLEKEEEKLGSKVRISMPLYHKGEFIGVIASDISLSFLQNQVLNYTPEKGVGMLISNKGNYLAHTGRPQDITKNILDEKEEVWKKTANDVLNGKEVITNGRAVKNNKEVLRVLVPIEFENLNIHWTYGAVLFFEDIMAEYYQLRSLIIVMAALVMIVILGILIFITRKITNPLLYANESLQKISEGNLNINIKESNSKDETGMLIHTIKTMAQNLTDIAKNLITESKNINNAMNKAEKSLIDLKEKTDETSATTQQLSASMEETSSSIQDIYGVSVEIKDVIEKMTDKTSHGEESARDIFNRANKVKTYATNSANEAIEIYEKSKISLEKALEKSMAVEKISRFTTVIEEISEETNLLSLNASIEAARAGKEGNGFLVVAQEIRKLSENTKGAIEEIKDVIHVVTNGVEDLQLNAKDMLSFIEQKVKISYKEFEGIGEQYKEDSDYVKNLISEFNDYATYLKSLTDKINQSINEMTTAIEEGAAGTDDVSVRNLRISEDVADVVHEINKLLKTANQLDEISNQFKI